MAKRRIVKKPPPAPPNLGAMTPLPHQDLPSPDQFPYYYHGTPWWRPEAQVIQGDFHSWSDALEFIQTRQRSSSRKESESPGPSKFYATANLQEALGYAWAGWPEAADAIADIANPLRDVMSTIIERHETLLMDEGEELDVDTWLNGQPEAWLTPHIDYVEGYAGRRIFKIVYNVAATCNTPRDVMHARGAAAAALVTALELAGHGTDLWVSQAVRTTGGLVDIRIHLKPPDQFLDMGRLAFAVSNPDMLRRIIFAIEERFPPSEYDLCHNFWGYGSPAQTRDQGDIYFGALYGGGHDPQWGSPKATIQSIANILGQNGIALDVDALSKYV